jgi:hypothetical protein
MNRYVVATAAVTLLIVGAAFALALRDGANHASSAGPVPTVEGSSASEKPAAPSADGQAALTTTASLATATVPASVRLGTWQRLPAAPIAVPYTSASVWTGTEMLIFGRVTSLKGGFATFDVAAAYNPATETWRKLHPGPGLNREGHDEAVWTGSEMLVTGITSAAYNPATNRSRLLPAPPPGWDPAFTVWTGRRLIGWGGGCCGDSNAWGAAYTPATNSWEMLPRAPLAGRQGTVGAWTGTELIIVGGNDADGKVFATAAARAPHGRDGDVGRHRSPRRWRPTRVGNGPGEPVCRRSGLQPVDQPLAAAARHGNQSRRARRRVDRQPAAGMGRGDHPRRCLRSPAARARLRPGDQPLVAAAGLAATWPIRGDRGLDRGQDDPLGRQAGRLWIRRAVCRWGRLHARQALGLRKSTLMMRLTGAGARTRRWPAGEGSRAVR